jgi:ABC-type phosphate transport system substrate-binding protein
MLVIALMTFSVGLLLMQAHATGLPWTNGQLVTPGQLTVAGSSTVGPIAAEEINSQEGNFVGYWNNLVNTGAVTSSTISQVNLATLGSGTAIPALAGTQGAADVGEMSRPPSDGEFATAGMQGMQQYAIGVDSVAIVASPDMTWFPASLTTNEVAQLFVDTTSSGTQSSQGLTGVTGSTPLFQTWGNFFTAFGISTSGVPAAALSENIQRAVRDPTSGTFDCFNNYFVKPNGYNFEYQTYISGSSGPKTVTGSQEMAPFTYCEENINIFNTVSAGNTASGTDYIGFISLGYLNTYGVQNGVTKMIGINISYNTAPTPAGGTSGSPIIAYYGTGQGFPSGTSNPPTWGTAVTPTDANVIYAYSGIKGSEATGMYYAWRWLWEVVPGTIPSTGPLLVAGVWIAYMMADGTTTTGEVAVTPGTGTSSFVLDNNYIQLERDDMAGGSVLDSNLVAPPTGYPLATQTQSYPTGVVNFNDITYFVGAYINYQVNHIYNPYADMDANGVINFNDIALFVGNYIAYYTTWNPI